MGKMTGFIELQRIAEVADPVNARVRHYREFIHALDDDAAAKQGARCMDCGIPFCQSGCPVNNIIPDWNDLVYRQQWQDALDVLHSTNNFPEFTGRICPAPCEAACTLNINNDPVGIKSIEHFIIDKGYEEGWVVPQPPSRSTGKRIAVVGSGPAGLACAQQLARAGHDVVLFEKEDRIGGLLRYGIPDFKMEKHLHRPADGADVDRGRRISPGCARRRQDVAAADLLARVRCDRADRRRREAARSAGARARSRGHAFRDGVPAAAEPCGCRRPRAGADQCHGQARDRHRRRRHGLRLRGHVEPAGRGCRWCSSSCWRSRPSVENKPLVWPYWPIKLRTSSSHEEGCDRDWSVATKRFEGSEGRVTKLVASRVEWQRDGSGATRMVEMPGSEFTLQADLVLLAMGFWGPARPASSSSSASSAMHARNVKADTDDYRTSVAKVFAAGDMRRGQSLVVWAIREGRQCAHAVDAFLMGSSSLPR